MEIEQQPMPAVQTRPLSQSERVVNTFIAPSKTFNDLRRSANWLLPWVLISIASLCFVYAIDRQIGFEQITKSQIERSGKADQFDKLPPEQKKAQLAATTSILRYSIYAAPILNLFFFLVMALVLMGAFNFAAGASVPFKVAYAIVVFGSLPTLVGGILGTASLFAGIDPQGFSIQNPIASNVAYFMSPSGNKFLYGMASSIDVFNLWCVALMGLGFACNSRVKKGTAIAMVAGFYFAYKLVTSGLASLG